MIYQPQHPKNRARQLRRLLLAGAGVWAVVAIAAAVVIYLDGRIDQTRTADVIIVLGAGLRPDSSPGPALIRRSNRAADLWEQGYAPVIICTGGMTSRATHSEAWGCEKLLRARGVPPEAIVLEAESRSTEENALNVHAIMRQHDWRTALLVSDSYHMLRACWLFEQKGMTVYSSPVPSSQMPVLEYMVSVGREIVAFHWQVFKQLFNLPVTHVSGI